MGVQVDKLESEARIKSSNPLRAGYLQELKNELKQVTWTSKTDLVMFTKIVVSATFVFGLGIYGVDLLIKGCLAGFKTLIYLIFG